MSFRSNGYPILFSGETTQKEVWNGIQDHKTRLIQPYCIIYKDGCFRLVCLAVELFDPKDFKCLGTLFWGADCPADPIALYRAVKILAASTELHSNSLCSAWFAAKGMNRINTPGDIPNLVKQIGYDRYQCIMSLFPRRLEAVLDKLWRYHIRVDTAALRWLVENRRLQSSPQLERLGLIVPDGELSHV